MRTPQVQISLHHFMDVNGCPRPLIGRGPHFLAWTKSGRSIALPVQRHLSLGAWHGRRPAIPILEHKVVQRQFLWVWSRFTRRTSRMPVRRLIGTIGPGSLHDPRNGLIEERG